MTLNDPYPQFQDYAILWRWISQQILIGTYTRLTQQCHFEWPWVTLSDLAKSSMTRSVARSLCDSWASCHNVPELNRRQQTMAACFFLAGPCRKLTPRPAVWWSNVARADIWRVSLKYVRHAVEWSCNMAAFSVQRLRLYSYIVWETTGEARVIRLNRLIFLSHFTNISWL